MKTKHQKVIGYSILSLVLCGAFMNSSRINWEEEALERIDLKIRNTHAKELLGKSYRRSVASQHEENINLSVDLLRRVQKLLPKKYAHHSSSLTQTIIAESKKFGFDPVFVMAIIQTESGWNPKAVGGVGEIGLMQIRPETAEWIAKQNDIKWTGAQNLKNPATNVKIGIAYMSYLRSKLGKVSFKYVSAYNMGPNALKRLVAQNIRPKEYKKKVMANYEIIYKSIGKQSFVTASL
jgi:soluble lytic murein transglycosylase